MRAVPARISAFNLVAVGGVVLALLLLGGSATSVASSDGNLILNTELKSLNGSLPPGWRVHTIPDCGFRFEIHPDPSGANVLEMINDAPIESMFEQEVQLKPGWYSFSAEIKIESVGSEGAAPELFVKAASFSVEHRVHPLEWTDDWQQYRAVFRAGQRVSDFVLGCALGQWGYPNSGRFLFRNPVLVPTDSPQLFKTGPHLQVDQGYDMEGKVEERYFNALAQASAPETSPAHQSNRLTNELNKRWTVIALNLGLLVFAGLGWWTVSPREPRDPS